MKTSLWPFILTVALLAAANPTPAGHAPPAIGLPAGTIVAWGGATIPDGWLLCDGKDYKKFDFPDLWNAIQTIHGDGRLASGSKGVGDFNVPDLRGRFLRGLDASPTMGSSGRDSGPRSFPQNQAGVMGNQPGSVEEYATALPKGPTPFLAAAVGSEHSHTVWGESNATRNPELNNNCCPWTHTNHHNDNGIKTLTDGAHQHTLVGGDVETRPNNVAIYYIIKSSN